MVVDFSLIFCLRLSHLTCPFYATGSCEYEGRGRCHCLLQVPSAIVQYKLCNLSWTTACHLTNRTIQKVAHFSQKSASVPYLILLNIFTFDLLCLIRPTYLEKFANFSHYTLSADSIGAAVVLPKCFFFKLFLRQTVPLENCSFG
jgi:hypothetical protein